MDRRRIVILAALAWLIGIPATASVADDVNWADEVIDYSANIQNYGGVLMDVTTEWWLTGPPDADVNGNGYAWDAVDQDTVAGWRSTFAGEYVTAYWEAGLPDLPGDDLWIHLYGGPSAEAEVSASVDGTEYVVVGAIGGGTPGYLRQEAFDFAGLFETRVHYVRILRIASGPQTGLFFDALGGGSCPSRGDLDGDYALDMEDVPHFIDALLGNLPAHPGIDQSQGDMNLDDAVDGNDIQLFILALIEFA